MPGYCSQLLVSGISAKGPWASPAFISLHLSDLQDHSLSLSSTQDLLHLLSGPPSSLRKLFINPAFFGSSFLWKTKHLVSPNLKSMCRSTVCDHPFNWWICFMFLLLMEGFRTCHFYLVRVLSRFMISPYWLQQALSRLLLDNSKVQFQTFISPCNTYTQSASC